MDLAIIESVTKPLVDINIFDWVTLLTLNWLVIKHSYKNQLFDLPVIINKS